jgi:hypothetical protein
VTESVSMRSGWSFIGGGGGTVVKL